MKRIILVIAIFCIANVGNSQCSIENDDDQLINGTSLQSGQSFIASCNGILNSIGILTFTSDVVNVTLYDGEGYGGTVLGTLTNQTTSPFSTPTDYSEFDFSALNITLISGQTYTLDISNIGGLIAYDNEPTPNYADGQRYENGISQANSDLLFLVNLTAIPCTDPDIPMVTHAPTTLCEGDTATLSISGNLNDATEWHIYTGACGGTEIGTTSTSSFVVTPSSPSTTYFVRGEGGLCVVPGSCANLTVNVTANDVASYSAPADLCINAGIQTSLGGGTPTGGVYSGPGVTDDGNGLTYSFNPTIAGIGTHSITYTSAGTCNDSSSDSIEVFALPNVTFNAPTDICIDQGTQTGLTGGSPAGGIYSGSGVTDSGNGTTYSFNPATAGAGVHTITYSFTNANGCNDTASDTIEIFELPNVTFNAPTDICIDQGTQTGLTGGSPAGGIYSGSGVTDSGNGTTYSFNPATAGAGVHTITYSFTNANGCTDTASDTIEVFALPNVTFNAPTDICIDQGTQTGLTGGSPAGGTYSGTGVTDDGNGTTYSFNPATAGAGIHTITYSFTNTNGCTDTASDTIEVFELPNVTFNAPTDICIDQGTQTGLTGGSPAGGIYSGSGVTDNGNGTTYSFNPATAGAGIHTITYSFTNANGCTDTASDTIEVFALPNVTFNAPTDICIDQGTQTGLTGGSPAGGIYSGSGVTDSGNGTTYSFNPATAGAGVHTITYSFTNANGCTDTASDTIEVFELPNVTFNAPTDICIDQGTQTGLTEGSPAGGIYSGSGVTDSGNGTTYSFNPATAGAGVHTITYSFTNANGCTDTASDTIEVFELPNVTFNAPTDICIDQGTQTGLTGGSPAGGIYSGPGVTDDGNGTTYSFNPTIAAAGVHTITYSFTNANACNDTASDTIEVFGIPDTSVDDTSSPTFTANISGASYQWIDCETNTSIPGETNQSFTAIENGNYSVEITFNGCSERSSCFLVATLNVEEEELKDQDLRIYPIPTKSLLNISIPIKKATIFNMIGKKVFESNTNTFDISELNSGIYFVNIEGEKGNTVKRIIKE
ncbi:T9SS C-terminal target domain-containing protein [Aquimarina sp. AD1]|uniref:T9SS type A sorting domain-containing protein n=3 Tax=Aquimarina TaxID=290174 RepID=UPI000E54E630|nr:T9SS type A sorting domain-containing protein [Aquimarina sp. AD1]AXT56250.1 T9SS C-terminal target domain-containing protein [Aquimarina sp. AD1]RKN30405.1 T9SS C-terminal target domain-containing protein [Aquimarina sp. AD1]